MLQDRQLWSAGYLANLSNYVPTEATRMKLSGLRVLDLSRFLPGPYLTMVMADHGAEVIKVESHQGEPTRQLGSPVGGSMTGFGLKPRPKGCSAYRPTWSMGSSLGQ